MAWTVEQIPNPTMSELRMRMGKKGRENILQLCSPSNRSHAISALIDSILVSE